jgi:hypothetical protein
LLVPYVAEEARCALVARLEHVADVEYLNERDADEYDVGEQRQPLDARVGALSG